MSVPAEAPSFRTRTPPSPANNSAFLNSRGMSTRQQYNQTGKSQLFDGMTNEGPRAAQGAHMVNRSKQVVTTLNNSKTVWEERNPISELPIG